MIRQLVLQVLVLGVFPAGMAFAAASDLITMTISNRLSIALAVGFFAMAAVFGLPLVQVAYHVLAALIVLAACFTFFAFGWIGGGDAKLAAATALWFGFAHLMEYLLVASLAGGALTLILLKARTVPLPGVLAGMPWLLRLHSVEAGIPYGIALAFAGLVVYPKTFYMQALAG